jgi:acyl dehydratase
VTGNETHPTIYADDLVVGQPVRFGTYQITRRGILEFAEQWDPQPIHVDPAAGAAGRFGEIIASGLHTFSIFNRLATLHVYPGWALIAGRRVSVEYPSAVRPGMLLEGSITVTSVRPYSTRSSTVVKSGELHDVLSGATVFTMGAETYMARRPPI